MREKKKMFLRAIKNILEEEHLEGNFHCNFHIHIMMCKSFGGESERERYFY